MCIGLDIDIIMFDNKFKHYNQVPEKFMEFGNISECSILQLILY